MPVSDWADSMAKAHCVSVEHPWGTTAPRVLRSACTPARNKAIVFLFMTADALDRFRSSEGWSAGADASVAVLKVGANGNVDAGTATGQINAFVLTNGGLMAGATVDGTKVTRLKTL